MKEISYERLKKLKEDFPKGTRVELIKMDDPYTTLKAGDKGTVAFIDDMATIHVNLGQRQLFRISLWRGFI